VFKPKDSNEVYFLDSGKGY